MASRASPLGGIMHNAFGFRGRRVRSGLHAPPGRVSSSSAAPPSPPPPPLAARNPIMECQSLLWVAPVRSTLASIGA